MAVSRAIDIAHLFRGGIFSHEQIHKVGKICKVLGKYMFLDRELLEIKAGEKIGLSYLEKCKKNNIITELKYEREGEQRDKYFFQLDVGGLSLLEQAGMGYVQMNVLADDVMKSRIITFNYYAHNSGKDIEMGMPHDYLHRYFFCKGNIVTYFKQVISEEKIIEKLQIIFGEKDPKTKELIPLTPDEVKMMFRFYSIDLDLIDVGNKTKSTEIKKGGE